ncbi:MAG: T9SS type A sorting domain-containing protein [Candidatus Krumholzibacteria bacterium]|nr:T9SS type A sorting domain-containing protein [Candidatus Krumholzibacteria bacterium]
MRGRMIALYLAFLLLATGARSGIIEKTVRFDSPSLQMTDEGVRVVLRGCATLAGPGEPAVPVYPARFLIPAGHKVIRIISTPVSTVEIQAPGRITPMPGQHPLGTPHPMFPELDESIYSSVTAWPPTSAVISSTQAGKGFSILFIDIFPCRIVPSRDLILYSPEIRVSIETAPSTPDEAPRARKQIPGKITSKGLLPGLTDREFENPYDIKSDDRALSVPPLQEDGSRHIPYLIITAEALMSGFEGIAELKKKMGLETEIVTVEWIEANMPGADIQEKIRNLIIEAYESWGTEFVLLGGDEEIIPHRDLYVKAGSEIEPDIPSDLYYSGLDGDWNTDSDLYYGEPGEEDLIPELLLGRLPVNTLDQVSNFSSKLELYTFSPPPGSCETSLMTGELLWDDVVTTWGGDYKDEILGGTDNYGFETEGIPASFTSQTLYERDLGAWPQAELVQILNNGVNLVNHLGHANWHSVMKIPIWDIGLLNGDAPGYLPFICYSQGCYPASFDNRDDQGTVLADDAIGEQLVTASAGAVAFIGNTRLGWGAPGSTSSVSQYFDRQFFDALFGEKASTLGEAFEDSRIDNIPYITYAAFRYVYYNMCLLGDPAMPVWTTTPSTLDVLCDSVFCVGEQIHKVEVTSGGLPVGGARVSIRSEFPDFYTTTFTDEYGQAWLDAPADSITEVELSVWAADHYIFNDSITTGIPCDACLSFLYFSVDDDSTDHSLGDSDGIIESGETIELNLALRNEGTTGTTGTIVTINCPDQYVTVWNDTLWVGEIPARAAIILEDEFVLEIADDIPDGHSIELDINIISEEQYWNSQQSLSVNAPGLQMISSSITDSLDGNNNGCIEGWEFLNIETDWSNNGSMNIVNPVLSLSALEGGWARVIRKAEALPDIPIGESVSSEYLQVFIQERTPPFTDLTFFVSFMADNVPSRVETLSVTTCGTSMQDDVSGQGAWRHSALVGYDGWHVSDEEFSSSPLSWKSGSSSGGIYPNMMDVVLVTPPLCLHENSTLSFNHRMEAEASAVYPYWAQDAGVVEISTDGGDTWTIITPLLNYPCRAASSNTIFLAPYQKCYSGSFGWVGDTFDLSAFHGPALLRFHFATNEQIGFDGWYIDDISITTDQLTGDDPPPMPGADGIRRIYPNPFNPATIIEYENVTSGKVELAIYDVTGRRVRTLVNRHEEPGIHRTKWNGKNDNGKSVSSGVYFLRYKTGIYSASARLVLVR